MVGSAVSHYYLYQGTDKHREWCRTHDNRGLRGSSVRTTKWAQHRATTCSARSTSAASRKETREQFATSSHRGASKTASERREPVWTRCWKSNNKACEHSSVFNLSPMCTPTSSSHYPFRFCCLKCEPILPSGEGVMESGRSINSYRKEFAKINRYFILVLKARCPKFCMLITAE